MTKSLPPEHVREWEAKVLAWEIDPTEDDPYAVVSLREFISFCKMDVLINWVDFSRQDRGRCPP